MFIVVIIIILALLLTCLETQGLLRHGMMIGFSLLTILGAIHYNYGNDYMVYYNLYYTITSEPLSFNTLIEDSGYKEKGWVLLCQLFSKLGGFFMMVAVLNVVQNFIIYNFIRKNVNAKWWTMSVFVYTFTTVLYLMNFSMMRQGFVVCVFLGLWHFIENKKWVIAFLVIYLCSFIHSSAIVLLPFAFWGYIPVKNGKVLAMILGVLFVALWMSGQLLNSFLEIFMTVDTFSEYFDTYSDLENNKTYGVGFALMMIPLILTEYYFFKIKDTDKIKRMVLLSSLSFIIMPFSQMVPLIGRIGTYFTIYRIASVPIIYRSIKNRSMRLIYVILYVFLHVYSCWMFFTQGVFSKPYQTFHTIFEAI